MPYRTFNNWLFDGRKDTPIPAEKDGINLLKYNSPITHTFLITQFIKHGPLNQYLNQYFNNIGVRYINKAEMFKFIKRCVQDFKITKRDIAFFPRHHKVVVYEKLRERMPELKNDDIYLLVDIIEKSDQKDSVYDALGLDKPKKVKLTKGNKKIKGVKNLMQEHFSTIKVK